MTREEAYWEGFINKCAELGVDPEALIKQAQLSAALQGVGKAIGPAAKGAWATILAALRKHVPRAAQEALSTGEGAVTGALGRAFGTGAGLGQFTRGVGAAPRNVYRGLLSLLHGAPSLAAAPATMTGRVGEMAGLAGMGGAGIGGLRALLGGGKEAPAAEAPSGMLGPGGVHPSM